MTMCIMPWAAIGASHEKALSMRAGVLSAAISRSSGPVGKPSGGPGSGVFGFTSAGLPAGLSASGVWRGNGGL
jgi:hypothetical protein